ncbi:MAG: GntR family transcriptional regulator, partial [Bacteroidota bacterium]
IISESMDKLIFKNEIREILLKHILTGQYQPGERLSLPGIAKELDVSVTPIREALTQLSESGIVNYIANRGFFLSGLSSTEAKEIYELMAILESHALEKSSFTDHQLKELIEINTKLSKERKTINILELDRQFHQKLIENYSNNFAIKIISNLRVQISIYEYAFWNELNNETSIKMHDEIIQYIRKGNISSAINRLKENWLVSVKHIIKKLEVDAS